MEPKHVPDNAEPEIMERILTRRDAIRQGASVSSMVAAGVAMGSAPVTMAALATDTYAQGGLPGTIVDVLNFALMLEQLGIDFYNRGLAAPGLLTGDTRQVFEQIRKHEVGHAAYLQSVLGGRAMRSPGFDFTGGMGRGNGPFADVFSNPRTFMTLAQAFEDLGVRAIKGQAPFLLPNDAILEAGLRMHSVEARHASQVRRMRGLKGWIVQESPDDLPAQLQSFYNDEDNTFHFILAPLRKTDATTQAFDEPLTRAEVLAMLRPFLATGR